MVGWNYGSIGSSHASGTVTGDSEVGGLVGANSGFITNVSATGAVSGNQDVGGLAGENYASGIIANAFATGTVTGQYGVGGLIGVGEITGVVRNAYAVGAVAASSGAGNAGGLIGENNGESIQSLFWSPISTGQSSAVVGSGAAVGMTALLSDSQASSASTYAGWDFSTVWSAGSSYPTLRPFATASLFIGPATIDGISYSSALSVLGITYAYITSSAQFSAIDALSTSQSLTGSYYFGTGIYQTSNFTPIGNGTFPFQGVFNGAGNSFESLSITTSGSGGAGLFGVIGSGGQIVDSSASGTISAGTFSQQIGGLVGENWGTIQGTASTNGGVVSAATTWSTIGITALTDGMLMVSFGLNWLSATCKSNFWAMRSR